MVKEAELHVEEDKNRRQEVEIRNQADSLVYTTEKTLNEHRDKLSTGDIKPIEEAIEDTKKALESGDSERIKSSMDRLTKTSHKLAEAMYQQHAYAGTGSSSGAGEDGEKERGSQRPPKGDGEVVDAEFEES